MKNTSKLITNNELSIEDIDGMIKECKVSQRLYQRLIFLRTVKQGFTIIDASKLVNVARQTGAEWLKRYNKDGFEGLMPKFSGGRPSYLTDEQKKELKETIIAEGASYTIEEVRELIKEKYNVEYTYKQVWVIVRKKFGLSYTKPFPLADDKPENGREDLKKTPNP